MQYSIEDSLGLSPFEVGAMFKKEVHSPPNLIAGAVETLNRFTAADYDIGILTHRSKFMSEAELQDWLDEAEIPYGSILTYDSLPTYVHAMIDDCPAKLCNVNELTQVSKLLLFDQACNRNCLDIKGRFTRVGSWKQVWEEINGV
jgi:hypothetical protein